MVVNKRKVPGARYPSLSLSPFLFMSDGTHNRFRFSLPFIIILFFFRSKEMMFGGSRGAIRETERNRHAPQTLRLPGGER